MPVTDIISLVGGGGKTSTMYALANESVEQGGIALITTSTHIWKPDHVPVVYDFDSFVAAFQEHRVVCLGGSVAIVKSREKLAAPETVLLERCITWMDEQPLRARVLIEADGSRSMPIKVPREHEPVILPETRTVVGVVGLDAVGKRAKDVCFAWTGTEDQVVTEELAADILTSTNGTKKGVGERKYIIALNKADTPERVAAARRIRGIVQEKLGCEVWICVEGKRNTLL